MIYGRFGQVVTIVRMATIEDVKGDGRKGDQRDRDALKAGSFVMVNDAGRERLYHRQDFLKADEGPSEIARAIDALRKNR